MADHTFEAGAGAYGFLTAAMGAGSVVGGLVVATWGRTGIKPLVLAALAFGVAMAVAAAAPSLPILIALMVIVGA